MTAPSQETQIALLIESSKEIKEDVSEIKGDIKGMRNENKEVFATKSELQLTNDRLKRIETVAGLIGGTVLLAVIGAIMRLVIVGAK